MSELALLGRTGLGSASGRPSEPRKHREGSCGIFDMRRVSRVEHGELRLREPSLSIDRDGQWEGLVAFAPEQENGTLDLAQTVAQMKHRADERNHRVERSKSTRLNSSHG